MDNGLQFGLQLGTSNIRRQTLEITAGKVRFKSRHIKDIEKTLQHIQKVFLL